MKYHGLGNDFVLLDRLDGGELPSSALVRKLCDRHRGVGADGVLTMVPNAVAGSSAAARMIVQNADGSDAGMCGNGMRCVARYLVERRPQLVGISGDMSAFSVAAGERVYQCARVSESVFTVAMGVAEYDHTDLPTAGSGAGFTFQVSVLGEAFNGVCLSMGNPHFVTFVDGDPMEMARRYGAGIESHEAFPNRVNASFVRQEGEQFRAVVYERGVGITMACGTGACAVGAAAVKRGLSPAGRATSVMLPGGILDITVGADGAISMQGEAVRVYSGTMENLA